MEEKDKYKFLLELGKGMDKMVENDELLLTQKTQILEQLEVVLFDKIQG